MANPWDFSQILLNNRAGAFLGQGIADAGSSLGSSITRAVMAHRDKMKEKEAEDSAISWLKKNGSRLGLNSADDAELKAAVKAAGGGPQAIQMISGLQQQEAAQALQKQQMEVTAAQLKDLESRRAGGLRRSGAARLAAGGVANKDELAAMIQAGDSIMPGAGGSPDAAVADYLRRSGDVEGAGGMAEAFSRLNSTRGREPYAVDFGNGLRGVVSNGNFVADPRLRTRPEDPVTKQIDVGGRKLTVGPGDKYFDEAGKPVQFAADRPPAAPDIFLKSQDPELYQAMRSQYLDYVNRNGAPDAEGTFGPEYEGKKVKGPDGKTYLIRNGKPVLQ